MKQGFVIIESVGPSIYERYTIPFVYMKKEWADHQCKILQEQSEKENGGTHTVIAFQIVESGPK